MPNGFLQQAPLNNLGFIKSAPEPQHGQKAHETLAKTREPRSFQPRRQH